MGGRTAAVGKISSQKILIMIGGSTIMITLTAFTIIFDRFFVRESEQLPLIRLP
jgi:hypothetical protein